MKTITVIILGLIGVAFATSSALAGVFELGGAFGYQKSTYNAGSYNWVRTWSADLGYYFTEDSEVQFLYQDSVTKTFDPSVEDITYRDRVYSLNMLYYLFDDKAQMRPSIRMGLGQLNRDVTGSYVSGAVPPGRMDQVTVILGAGFKAKITGSFSLKAEATTYMAGGNISTWKDNVILNVGGSFYF